MIYWFCIFIYATVKQMHNNINYDNDDNNNNNNNNNNNIKNNQHDSNHQLFRL